jgi:hypothetical protein
MPSSAHPQPRTDQTDRITAQQHRQAAFARIARVRGASILGAGALTAALAAVVSAIAPGHSLGAKKRTGVASTTATAPARAATTAKLPPLASPRSLGLRSPSGAPQTAPSSPQSTPPAQPSAPTQPSPPVQQVAPAPSQSGPVVSGGS